ncbi:MAG: hypothetical protein JRF61_01360 [Deltaproteobacteria bacterium]|jgi:hypothetical protein|nr:hypothetical protein [Deltaproteobacteria bacterium]
MKSILSFTILVLFVGHAASAEPYWAQISMTTSAPKAPKVVAAMEKLMSSEVGKTFPGRMLLQSNVADGNDPATHTVVPIYRSASDRDAFVKRLQESKEWADFQATLDRLGKPGGTVLYRNLASWGDINDTDDVWMAHAFSVSDPAAFAAALDAFMNSPTGKKAPGQVYLSAVVAGGISPVSHVISVGYASIEEMAAWLPVRDASSDWASFVQAGQNAGTYLGGSMAADIQTWGPIGMKEIVAP